MRFGFMPYVLLPALVVIAEERITRAFWCWTC